MDKSPLIKNNDLSLGKLGKLTRWVRILFSYRCYEIFSHNSPKWDFTILNLIMFCYKKLKFNKIEERQIIQSELMHI